MSVSVALVPRDDLAPTSGSSNSREILSDLHQVANLEEERTFC